MKKFEPAIQFIQDCGFEICGTSGNDDMYDIRLGPVRMLYIANRHIFRLEIKREFTEINIVSASHLLQLTNALSQTK
jgi:hypothetical protein